MGEHLRMEWVSCPLSGATATHSIIQILLLSWLMAGFGADCSVVPFLEMLLDGAVQ